MTMTFNKLKKVTFFSLLLFLISFSFVLAQRTQLDYPEFPGITAWGGGLADFFRYLYQILLAVGAILAFSYFVFGGFLYFTSFGNPARMGKAKDLIISALLGLFILFASYAILSTIDPNLTIFNIQIFNFTLPSLLTEPCNSYDNEQDCQAAGCHWYNNNCHSRPGAPPGCFKIPLHKEFLEIHNLEKEALAIANRLEELIHNATSSIETLYETMQDCTCSNFTVECLSGEGGEESWHCPGWCPPDQGDPCPAGSSIDNDIGTLEANLSCSQEFIDLLEDDFNLNLSDNQEEEITEKIDDGLPEETTDSFIFWLEGELNHDFSNEERGQIRELLESCFSVQTALLEKILRTLTERRLDFEKYLVQVGECRQDITRQLWTCSQTKDYMLQKDLECQELDFWCCP